jgi:hypothetical protein
MKHRAFRDPPFALAPLPFKPINLAPFLTIITTNTPPQFPAFASV